MAKLIPGLIVIFCFSVLLSSSHAGSQVASPGDDVTALPTATFNEEDVSDLKSLIILPTDKPKEIEAVNQPGSGNFFDEIHVKDMPLMNLFEEGEKKPKEVRPTANWQPVNHRMHPIRCRYRRYGGGDKIRPQNMPIWKEDFDGEHHHHRHEGKDGEHHRHHHGENFPARFPDVEEGRMIGEFKEPHFFFRRHHHHHHHHHDDEDQFHHGEEDEMEEREHHRHRRGHGFWKSFRKFLGNF